MHPRFGSLEAYPIAYNAGLLLHFVLAYVFARRLGLRRWWALGVGLSYLLSMSVGARVLFDLTHGMHVELFDLFTPSFYERGGLWGGPLLHLALMTVIIVVVASPQADVFDLVALALPLPMLLAKAGCLLHGCCYGAPTSLPWGICCPPNRGGATVDVPIHPVQAYEMAVLAVVFATLMWLRGPRWRGLRLAWFLLLYGFGRGLIEFARGDAAQRLAIGPFTASQLICLGVALASAVVLGVRWNVGHPIGITEEPKCGAV